MPGEADSLRTPRAVVPRSATPASPTVSLAMSQGHQPPTPPPTSSRWLAGKSVSTTSHAARSWPRTSSPRGRLSPSTLRPSSATSLRQPILEAPW